MDPRATINLKTQYIWDETNNRGVDLTFISQICYNSKNLRLWLP